MPTAHTIKYHNNPTIKLSEREVEVLYLIAHEFKNKEIARMLFLSEHTVDTYRKKLLIKLRAKNSAGLVRRSFEERIMPRSMPNFLHGIPQEIINRQSSDKLKKHIA